MALCFKSKMFHNKMQQMFHLWCREVGLISLLIVCMLVCQVAFTCSMFAVCCRTRLYKRQLRLDAAVPRNRASELTGGRRALCPHMSSMRRRHPLLMIVLATALALYEYDIVYLYVKLFDNHVRIPKYEMIDMWWWMLAMCDDSRYVWYCFRW